MKIYLDRLSTYKNTHKSVIDDPQVLTQFQRMMAQSDVELISAYSPQVKGRIETLFPTLKHRLVRELRLAGIKTPKEGNRCPGFEKPLRGQNKGCVLANFLKMLKI